MSTEVSIEDEATFSAAIRDVRNDACETTYVICGHVDGSPNKIQVLHTGSDTADIPNQMNSDEIMYGLARFEIKFDMSTTIKFVYIKWIGENIAVGKKGRYGVVHGSIQSHFTPYHETVETSSADDLDPEKLLQTLMTTAGTKSMVLENSELPSRQMRGFTASQLPKRSAKKGFGVSAVSTKGADVDVDPQVLEAVAKVKADDDATSWMVAGYEGANPKGPVVCMGSGEGGLDELKACLDASLPMYAMMRVSHKDSEDITTVKFVYITWVGTKVKPMTKAKTSTHKGWADETFSPSHVTVFANELSDIVEGDIMEKIKQQGAR